MNYKELEAAVINAYRQGDPCLSFTILDNFIDSASDRELGDALSLKASLIGKADPKRAPEGLTLVDEALLYMNDLPDKKVVALITALALCWRLGDVEKARKYELEALRLLRHYPGHPVVRKKQHRLHLNFGMLSTLRGEHAAAYWHYMQGANALLTQDCDDDSEVQCYLFDLYIHMVDACLMIRRFPESEDCLAKARDCIQSQQDRIRWTLAQARMYRCTRREAEAANVLRILPPFDSPGWTPVSKVQYHLITALLAQDEGDIRRFHQHLSIARDGAVEHTLDSLICDIQRVLRTPLTQEVAR